jgi:hypothetical protein
MADFSEKEMEELTKEKMARTYLQQPTNYLQQEPPSVDRVKELYYAANQDGFYDRTVIDQTGKQVGLERTPGDIPQRLKDRYYWLINKSYALGTVSRKEKEIDAINVKLGMLLYNAQFSRKLRTIQDLADQHQAIMLHESEISMSTDGFNRVIAGMVSGVTQHLFKSGGGIKNAVQGVYNMMAGGGQDERR